MSDSNAEKLIVSGRGELQLSILIEDICYKSYEFVASCPKIIKKFIMKYSVSHLKI
ncbi:hypothetical protein CLERM_571 [Coxiella-like endosymbiont]|nr:hypothetical protein CLERM_571 [Coxiella-like endosymbiont]